MIDAKKQGVPLIHYWSKCVGAGRAKEGLRAQWQKQLKTVIDECGFEYIRFHGLLCDDMCVYRIINGEEVYNFQYIDDLFDALLELGIRPVVEFSFMPSDMASGDTLQFWYRNNVTPPKSWDKWGELINKLVHHWLERYGLKEIKMWYYEVWNEPNLYNGFWTSGKADYFKMYEVTANAIKAVNSELKVGGPATSNFVPDDRFAGDIEDKSKHRTHQIENLDDGDWQPVWIKDFIEYCTKRNLPIDFFSTHPYPTDFALDGHGKSGGRSRNASSTRDDLVLMRKIVNESKYSNAEIILTEWSSSPSPRDNSHDYAPAAAYIVKSNIESRGLADALSYWTFTDIFEEGGAGNTAFHGGFGMINYQGIKKPSFYAYKFMHELGDTELETGDNYIVTRNSQNGKIQILAWNYSSETINTAVPMAANEEDAENVVSEGVSDKLNVKITGLRSNAAFCVQIVDSDSGCAMNLYKSMGRPSSPLREEIRLLKQKADEIETDIIAADEKGTLTIDITMTPWAIILIKEI